MDTAWYAREGEWMPVKLTGCHIAPFSEPVRIPVRLILEILTVYIKVVRSKYTHVRKRVEG